jgi:hypothetical protein
MTPLRYKLSNQILSTISNAMSLGLEKDIWHATTSNVDNFMITIIRLRIHNSTQDNERE